MTYDACIDCGIEKTGQRRKSARCRSCSKKGMTLSPEHLEKLRSASIGNTHRAGKTHSPETIAKMSSAKIGNTINTGRIQSLEHRRNTSLAQGGDGDIMNRKYPGLARWTRSVKETFTCCVVCRSTENLEAHHIVPKALYPQYATFIFNGVTLCKPCHKEVHGQN